jgi:hypothetical protein
MQVIPYRHFMAHKVSYELFFVPVPSKTTHVVILGVEGGLFSGVR